MVLDTNVTKVGNSFYVLIPSYLVDDFKLENGHAAEITLEGDVIVIKVRRKQHVEKTDVF